MTKQYLIFPKSDGGSRVESSRESFDIPPAEKYEANGLHHIGSYISRLFEPTNDFKSLSFFSTNGRGLGLHSHDGKIEAVFTLSSQTERGAEHAIRSFFESLGEGPSADYVAENGGIPGAALVLSYSLSHDLDGTVSLVHRMLVELCQVRPESDLQIKYWIKKK
jgi:hypothetical protein